MVIKLSIYKGTRNWGRFAPIFYFICENKIHRASPCKQITKKNFADFQNFQKSNFDRGKFLKILSFINLPLDHMMSHKKFGPDRFSRFDVYWIQTDKQTDRQTDKPNLYIEDTQYTLLDKQQNFLFKIRLHSFCFVLAFIIPFLTVSSVKYKFSNFILIEGSFASIFRPGVWRTPVILLLGGQYLGWYEKGSSIYSWFMLNWRPH